MGLTHSGSFKTDLAACSSNSNSFATLDASVLAPTNNQYSTGKTGRIGIYLKSYYLYTLLCYGITKFSMYRIGIIFHGDRHEFFMDFYVIDRIAFQDQSRHSRRKSVTFMTFPGVKD